MKYLITILFLTQLSSFSQSIDTVIYIDPNPGYDTSQYVDLQFGNARVDNEMFAAEFKGQNQMKFVGYHRQQRFDYHFITGELTDMETGRTGEIYEKGFLSDDVMDMLQNADETIFFMVVEFTDPKGEIIRRKSKFLIHGEAEVEEE